MAFAVAPLHPERELAIRQCPAEGDGRCKAAWCRPDRGNEGSWPRLVRHGAPKDFVIGIPDDLTDRYGDLETDDILFPAGGGDDCGAAIDLRETELLCVVLARREE